MSKKIKFQLPLANNGSIDLTNVIVSITPPATGVSFITAVPTVGTYDSVLETWVVDVLPVGATYHLYTEWEVTNILEAPFTFTVSTISDQNVDENTPADNTATKTYTLDDLYPCPNCPPPAMVLDSTTWDRVSGVVDFEPCTDCTTELTTVVDSEVNITSVELDSETGFYTVDPASETDAWEFQVEGNCINCPYYCNGGNDYGPFGPITVSGIGPCCPPDETVVKEEFLDLQSGSTVTLSSAASEVVDVHRNGILDSVTVWTFNGTTTITFDDAFDIGQGSYGENVRVEYKL